MSELNITKGSNNVFADLGFSAEEAQNLMLRSQTMIAISQWYESSGMTQKDAAIALGITQPRLNQLLKGKIEFFSLDALVNMATRAGMRVVLSINPLAGVNFKANQSARTRKHTKQLAAA